MLGGGQTHYLAGQCSTSGAMLHGLPGFSRATLFVKFCFFLVLFVSSSFRGLPLGLVTFSSEILMSTMITGKVALRTGAPGPR